MQHPQGQHPQGQPQYSTRVDKCHAAHPLASQSSLGMSGSSCMIHVLLSISLLSSAMQLWPMEAMMEGVMEPAVCEGMGWDGAGMGLSLLGTQLVSGNRCL